MIDQNEIQAKKQIYDMIFMKKNNLKESLSTKSSSSKKTNQSKTSGKLDIEQFNIGAKLGSGKFG